jgi:hypothetical protein
MDSLVRRVRQRKWEEAVKALYILVFQENSEINGCDGSKAVPARPSAKGSLKARKSRQSEEKLTVFVCSTEKNLGIEATVLEHMDMF